MIKEVYANNFESYESFENFKLKQAAQKVAAKVTAPIKQVVQKKVETQQAKKAEPKTTLKEKVKAATTPLKKLVVVAKQGAETAKKIATTALLIPYYPVMRVMVKKKGINPETNPEKLTLQFYDTVVKGKNYDDRSQQRFEAYLSMGRSEDGESFDMTTIVAECVKYLKKAVEYLKKKGDKEEQAAAEETDGLAEQAMKKLKGGGGSGGDGEESSNMGLIIGGIAAAVLVAFLALKK